MALPRADSVPPMDDDPDAWFWEQRETLRHIRSFARSRRVSPYATLACVLRRAVSCIEPNVKLPATIGGLASINLNTVTVGKSGIGKGASDNAGFAAVDFPGSNGMNLDAPRPAIGSGEGLARLFKGRKDEPGLSRAHLTVPEVSTLAALAGRQGATLAGELLKANMGEQLGFNNAQKETTTAIEAHSYRLCLGVGAQPENCDFFLQREKDGFPQRFLWVSALDPYAPRDRPAPIEPLTVVIPSFGTAEHIIGVPETVLSEIDALRYPVLTGSDGVDPLDGHLQLTRLKVAFALALLDGQPIVKESDWTLASHLIGVSTRVRSEMREAIVDSRRRQNRAKAHDQAEREQIVAERLTEGRQQRAGKSVLSKLRKKKRASRRELRHNCASDIRAELDPVLDIWVEQGVLIKISGQSRDGDEFELAPEKAV